MPYASIQFRGIDGILNAFDNRGVPAWSLWQGKQFLIKGYDREPLQAFLGALMEGGSNAIYTLKVYEDLTEDEVKKIKSNTPDDGSFNFRLDGEDMQRLDNPTYRRNYGDLDSRLKRIEDLLTDNPESEAEPETIGSAAMKVLQDPQQLAKYIDIFRGIFSPGNPAVPPPMYKEPAASPAAAMGSVQEKQEQDLNRLEKAIDTLAAADPRLIEHLEKLASLATNNAGQFQMLLSMLEKF